MTDLFIGRLGLCHWRREADESKPYPYAKFNKSLDIPSYSDEEYKVCNYVAHVCESLCEGAGCVQFRGQRGRREREREKGAGRVT